MELMLTHKLHHYHSKLFAQTRDTCLELTLMSQRKFFHKWHSTVALGYKNNFFCAQWNLQHRIKNRVKKNQHVSHTHFLGFSCQKAQKTILKNKKLRALMATNFKPQRERIKISICLMQTNGTWWMMIARLWNLKFCIFPSLDHSNDVYHFFDVQNFSIDNFSY